MSVTDGGIAKPGEMPFDELVFKFDASIAKPGEMPFDEPVFKFDAKFYAKIVPENYDIFEATLKADAKRLKSARKAFEAELKAADAEPTPAPKATQGPPQAAPTRKRKIPTQHDRFVSGTHRGSAVACGRAAARPPVFARSPECAACPSTVLRTARGLPAPRAPRPHVHSTAPPCAPPAPLAPQAGVLVRDDAVVPEEELKARKIRKADVAQAALVAKVAAKLEYVLAHPAGPAMVSVPQCLRRRRAHARA
jgi:hypothetical protein